MFCQSTVLALLIVDTNTFNSDLKLVIRFSDTLSIT